MKKVICALCMAVAVCASCGKMKDDLKVIDEKYISEKFLKAWHDEDWKTMYDFTHPNIMQEIRSRYLAPEVREMKDYDLFALEMDRVSRRYPHKRVATYKVLDMTDYKKSGNVMWVAVEINGKRKKIALTIDGVILKVDLTRMAERN